ncbi:hypothetical protein JHK84_041261 [Glycine max]|nr:hypothetical protein JHK84_041261 [Glycine max]
MKQFEAVKLSQGKLLQLLALARVLLGVRQLFVGAKCFSFTAESLIEKNFSSKCSFLTHMCRKWGLGNLQKDGYE